MRDMHCHILPGVDDGAANLRASVYMLDAAVDAGVDWVVCTPHVRRPYFDFSAMNRAYRVFKDAAGRRYPRVRVSLGWEVNHHTLIQLGFERWAPLLGFEGTGEFLLELSDRATPSSFDFYERSIFALQGMGYRVVIAHPERCRAIQEDAALAEDLVRMGCKLQASADFVAGGRLGTSKGPAKRLFKAGLYSYIASDAHTPEHYRLLSRAIKKYGSKLTP